MLSRIISPQSPRTFELPFSALVRLVVSVVICWFSSIRRCSSFLSAPLCSVCCVKIASTRLRNSEILSLKGFRIISIDSRFSSLKRRLCSPRTSPASVRNCSLSDCCNSSCERTLSEIERRSASSSVSAFTRAICSASRAVRSCSSLCCSECSWEDSSASFLAAASCVCLSVSRSSLLWRRWMMKSVSNVMPAMASAAMTII